MRARRAGSLDAPRLPPGDDSSLELGRGSGTRFPAPGFPRVFYLRYHGYAKYFPLWALARYRNLKRGNARRVAWGM